MTSFDYHNPVELIFGEGAFNRLGEFVMSAQRRALLVTGRTAARKHGYLDRAVVMLRDAGAQVSVYDEIPPNPTDDIVDAGGRLAREEGCELVVGLGGGSAMDAAKGIAIAATHEFPIREFLMPDESGNKRMPTDATLPIICATTTAGTSSELTPFAVITTKEGREKAAIAGPQIFPRVGICDPELTYHIPPRTTAATGVDVLCHAVEGYISTAAGPLTDLAAQEAIRLVGQYLPRLASDADDKQARHYLSLANVFAGIPLSNCGGSVMHALQHPVSAHYPEVAHGEGLAALMIAYAETCWEALPDKFARVSALLGGPTEASALAEVFEQLLDKVGMNLKLSQLGVQQDMLERIADDALRYMGGAVGKTPGPPDRDCLIAMLRASY